MADQSTSWILELVDRITGPMKKITQSTDEFEGVVNKVSGSLHIMDETSREAAKVALNDKRNLTRLLKQEQQEIEHLNKLMKNLPEDPWSRGPMQQRIDAATTKARRYTEQLNEVNHELKEMSKLPDSTKITRSFGEVIVILNQGLELAQKFSKSLDFAQDIKDLETNIQQMTQATGDELEEMTHRAFKLGEEFKDGGDEVARAAHVLSQNMQISMGEAFDMIEAGYTKGANLNGDMLDQLEKHSRHLERVGLSGSDAIALMVDAGQKGIFGPDALNSIKEADESLREMAPRTVKSLKGIGLAAKDFAGKTSFEAMQMISQAMDGKSVQAKQMVLKTIFKEAGENTGLGWIEGFSSIDMDINNMPNVERAGSSMREFLDDTKLWFSDTVGSIAITMQQLSGPVTMIAGIIPIFQALKKATWAQTIATHAATAAQWLWNAAVAMNPLFWIPVAIAAVIAATVWAYNEFEEFRAVLDGVGQTAIAVFENIWKWIQLLMAPIKIIIGFASGGVEGAKAAAREVAEDAKAWWDSTKSIASGEPFIEGAMASLEKSAKAKTEGKEDEPSMLGDIFGNNKLDGKNKNLLDGKNDLTISGGGGSKSITVNIDIKNVFNKMKGDMDLQKAANKISDTIMDRMRDTLITAG